MVVIHLITTITFFIIPSSPHLTLYRADAHAMLVNGCDGEVSNASALSIKDWMKWNSKRSGLTPDFLYACFPFIKSNFFASLWEPVHHSEKWPTTYLYNYADPLKQWMLTQGKFAFESLERTSADLLNKSLAH